MKASDIDWLASMFERICVSASSAENHCEDLDLNDFDGYIDEINILVGRIIRKLFELRQECEAEALKDEGE